MSATKVSVSFGNTVSLTEAAHLIAAAPAVKYFLLGEPGIGKSSLLKALQTKTGLHGVYVDCSRLELGDVSVPYIDRDAGCSRHYPSAMFGLHERKPVVICLDEFTKAPRAVQNMLHPMLEKAQPRLGDVPLPEGTIVFATGNLTTDGVGDNLAAHTMNRVVPVTVRKPSADEWLTWARNSGRIDPIVVAWVDKTRTVMESYLDLDAEALKGNPFIFNPRATQKGFVSPRSLETASDVLTGRSADTPVPALIAALSGALGEPGARALMAFVQYADQLPDDEEIFKSPKACRVPDVPGALHVLVNRLAQRAAKDNFAAIMTYMERLPKEWQTIFVTTVASMPAKQAIAFGNGLFGQWMARNQALL